MKGITLIIFQLTYIFLIWQILLYNVLGRFAYCFEHWWMLSLGSCNCFVGTIRQMAT